ncbi:hypothetical protein V1264_011386 [Littorina saxatilis]|uniref:Uncharacterized protein n=1 Tax=Littorina saxatilis TaxID=31220 RepID=A0AAN9BTR5_9CAEN
MSPKLRPFQTALVLLLVGSFSLFRATHAVWFNPRQTATARPAVFYDDGRDYTVTVNLRELILQQKCKDWKILYYSLWRRYCYSSGSTSDTVLV